MKRFGRMSKLSSLAHYILHLYILHLLGYSFLWVCSVSSICSIFTAKHGFQDSTWKSIDNNNERAKVEEVTKTKKLITLDHD